MKNEFGHIFLKRMGKNVLRPGGIEGTKFLLNNYDMTKKQKLLEAACNKGVNLMKLCMKYPQRNRARRRKGAVERWHASTSTQ